MPVIKVGTDCSGMEAPIQALQNLKVKVDHKFSCDIDGNARKTIAANFPHGMMYEDLTKRDNKEAPKVDVYVAGFPCQPFSSAGKMQGFRDKSGRGKIFYDVLDYIRQKRPRVFILENVSRMATLNKGKYLQSILSELEGLNSYKISWQLLNTKDHGLPQFRRRWYCVGILKSCATEFKWPEPIACATVDSLLEKRSPKLAMTGMPRLSHTTAVKNVRIQLRKLKRQGVNPHKVTHFVDCDCSPHFVKTMKTLSPCLTVARGNGFWISSRGRRMLTKEMMRFQGMNPTRFNVAVSELQLGKQLGNTMSVNVLERLFARVLPAAGLVSKKQVTDRWASGQAVKELQKTVGKDFKCRKVAWEKDSAAPAKRRRTA